MDVTFSQTEKMGRTSYIDLLYNHISVKNPQSHNNKYSAV